jgi:regulatory protein
MPTITQILLADKRAQVFAIEIDGQAWGELDAEVVVRRGLKQGLRLADDDLEALRRHNAVVRARRAALRLLARTRKSTNEVRRHLAQKRFEEDAIGEAIAYAQEVGALDDAGFARRFIRQQQKRGAAGPLRLRDDLRARGVEEATIKGALDETIDPVEMEEAARRLARKKCESLRQLEPGPRRRKCLEHLRRRGFEAELAERLIAELEG